MTKQEIEQALAKGVKVHWSNRGYEVIKDKFDRYLVVFVSNDYCSYLTDDDIEQCFLGNSTLTERG
jgi:hypothetical protein